VNAHNDDGLKMECYNFIPMIGIQSNQFFRQHFTVHISIRFWMVNGCYSHIMS